MRRGKHGTAAIFWTTLEKENDDGETNYIPMLKTFTVFNLEQIDGLPLSDGAVLLGRDLWAVARAEAVCRNSGATIIKKEYNAFSHHQSTKSAYRKVVFLPTWANF